MSVGVQNPEKRKARKLYVALLLPDSSKHPLTTTISENKLCTMGCKKSLNVQTLTTVSYFVCRPFNYYKVKVIFEDVWT